MSDVKLEDIVSLAKRRGFIYQGSEVYGGLSGTWDYGPLGASLKRNIEGAWLKMFVDGWDDMHQVDAAILMNKKVWEASGHVATFTDPMVECLNCKSRFRTDSLIDEEEYLNSVNVVLDWLESLNKDRKDKLEEVESLLEYNKNSPSPANVEAITEIYDLIQKNNRDFNLLLEDIKMYSRFEGFFPTYYLNERQKLKCPVCKHVQWGLSRHFNMLIKTKVGPTADEVTITGPLTIPEGQKLTVREMPEVMEGQGDTSRVYLRPETAQGIFTNYKNVLDSFYPDLPFGIAQIGKAFRNEISPRDFVFRSREFSQMEVEYFVDPAKWEESFEHWRKDIHVFLEQLGLDPAKIHELEVPDDDRAHYSKRTIDFEYDFPHKKDELLGLAYRTDFDLKNIQDNSGKNMEYTVKGTNEKFIPHVIEPSFGVERLLMAVLSSAYKVDEQNGEQRVYLALPDDLAPVRYAVSPLLKNKPELVEKAREVYEALKKKYGNVMWDDNGNIGKRYRRQDEIGTPYCVVIDFDTLEDDTVTIRDRDTTEQKRIKITEMI